MSELNPEVSKMIEKNFLSICSFSENRFKSKRAVRSSDQAGIKIIKKMRNLADNILENIECKDRDQFRPSVSVGQSNLPHVLWIAFTFNGRSVSQSMSVAICFGFKGEGAVAGVMDAATIPQVWVETIKRDLGDNLRVDVDSPRTGKYNDKFVNPQEFEADDNIASELVAHVNESFNKLSEIMDRKFDSSWRRLI